MTVADRWQPFESLTPEAQVHWDRDLGWRVREMQLRTSISHVVWSAVAWVPRYGEFDNSETAVGHCFLYFTGQGWVDRVYYLAVTRIVFGLGRISEPRHPNEIWS